MSKYNTKAQGKYHCIPKLCQYAYLNISNCISHGMT